MAEMQRPLNVMMIFAHPDEGEIYTGGTAALYVELGHRVKFLSLTNGDAGHFAMRSEDLARRRFKEAMVAKDILGLVDYQVLDYHDAYLENTAEIREQVVGIIEAWDADVVFTYYPAKGGHNDNMTAGWIVRQAGPSLKMDKTPVFVYVRDYHTSNFAFMSDVAVIIDDVWEIKLAACGAHESQVTEWNLWERGILDEVRGDEEKLRAFLYENTYAYSRIRPDNVPTLQRWYGAERTSGATYVEAFEFAEFGRQVTDAEVRVLFPMLPA
jgi:LmbE family N-acetylglucosaminyl deacetylase